VKRAIHDHLRDFLALLFTFVLAVAVAGYVLSEQRFNLPGWLPLAGKDFYTVKAELSSAQAVVPGQGQTVNIAGVKVGDVGDVRLENGVAVVEMDIDKEHAPIYRDATILLRPRTQLKDMYLALDPGHRRAGAIPEGGRVPVRNTLPDVNTDEILSSLDADVRSYLRVLLDSGGQAFEDSPKQAASGQSAEQDLRESLKRFEPTARDARAITGELSKRRRNLRRVVHNFQELVTELGRNDHELTGLVDSANANFQALARQDGNLRATIRELPGTLGRTTRTLGKTEDLATELGPALRALRPGARALGPALRQTRPFLRESTPIIRSQIRPFTREVRPTVRDVRPAARDLGSATPALARTFDVVNEVFDALAYNPRGSEEGYLFWASWLNHLTTALFTTQDAHGPVRRGVVLITCQTFEVLDQVQQTQPQLGALLELLDAPREKCPPPASTTGAATP
jgi:phospholipid/cholesterol/gamma-HCH transport system substrate-binding protein